MRDQLAQLWPTEDAITACIKQEAEAIEDAGVFLAVHQPMRFLRRDVGAGGRTVVQSEDDLLTEFLIPHLPEGRLLLPIVGSSGVGKSHVIRWIEAQLRRRPDRERFHIIRVPKESSLKGVLRLLLRDLEGPAFDRIRDALMTARDHLDPQRAARQLQLSLRLRLEREAAAAKGRLADGKPRAGDKELRDYGDTRMLPALLGEPLLEQEHWLSRSDGRPGVLAQMAEQVTQEGRREDDSRRHEFEVDDLVLADTVDLGQISKQAGRCYRSINRADNTRRAAAVRVLNLVLDDAKNDLLQLGDSSLVELFGDVRAELDRAGRTLIFLVEDFAVLSGLQGALLQVMITGSARPGRSKLCPMRSALAYTEGYMAGRDTVLTRARSEWLLEEHSGDDAETLERIRSLVGAYLNAARVGEERLGREYAAADSTDLRSWVPTVDGGQLALEPDVLSAIDAFGKSSDGYPLFPFSPRVIEQLARTGSVDSGGRLLFNPRLVINNVLTRILRARTAFMDGVFPPKHLADGVRSTDVTVAVGRRVPAAQLDRYLTVLALWGGQPTSLPEAAALPAVVYRSFGLAPIDFGVHPARLPSVPTPVVAETPTEATVDPREQRWRALLQDWAAGDVLAQRNAAAVRRWVADAMLGWLPTDALLLRPRIKASDVMKQVLIPQARGQGNVTVADAFVVVAERASLDDLLVRAKLVETLIAFARRYEIHKSWNYDGAERDGGLVRAFLEEREAAAVSHLRQRYYDPNVLAPVVRGLLVGARALNVSGVHDRASQSTLIAALYDTPPTVNGPTGAWADIRQSLTAERLAWQELLLEQVGARQGGAKNVHAVDAVTLVPLIEAAKSNWSFGNTPDSKRTDFEYKDFKRAFSDTKQSLARAVRDERAALLDWLPVAAMWFGDADKAAVQSALRDLVSEVKKGGLLPQADFPALRRQLTELPRLALAEAQKAGEALQASPGDGQVLSILASNPGRVLGSARRFVGCFDGFLTQVGRVLAGQEATLGVDVVAGAVQAVESELDALEGLLDESAEEQE